MAENDKTLAIIWHSRTGTAEAMARAAARGAGDSATLLRAEDTQSDILIRCAGFLFACPENLASMSGAMKEMFDRTYYDLLGQVEGRPYTYLVAGGSDGQGTCRQIERICTGWRLRKVADPIVHLTGAQSAEAIWAPKAVTSAVLDECEQLGAAMSEGIKLGIF